MEEVIKKLNEHDGEFKKVNKTLVEHTDQIDFIARTVADHTERFDRIESRLDKMDGKLDKMDNKIEGLATKNDIAKIMNVLDGMAGLVKKHDEEIVAINYNHKILDRRVDLLEQKV